MEEKLKAKRFQLKEYTENRGISTRLYCPLASSFCGYIGITHVLTTLQRKSFNKLMVSYLWKLSRLTYKTVDVDEHIKNILYTLSFYEKLVLGR